MIITNYHVQHVLRAYSQQLSDGSRLSRDKLNRKAAQKDEVTLSPESKKMLMVDKIANQIITHLTSPSERNETGQEILNRLSQEYGKSLDVASDNGNGLVFKVVDQANGGATEYLSPQETDLLQKRMVDIARSIVYDRLR